MGEIIKIEREETLAELEHRQEAAAAKLKHQSFHWLLFGLAVSGFVVAVILFFQLASVPPMTSRSWFEPHWA